MRYFVLFENGGAPPRCGPRQGHRRSLVPAQRRPGQPFGRRWAAGPGAAGGRTARRLSYNPADPVPSIGGHPAARKSPPPWAPTTRRAWSSGTTSWSTRATHCPGSDSGRPDRLQLWVQTDAPDADYTGKLCLVDGARARSSPRASSGPRRARRGHAEDRCAGGRVAQRGRPGPAGQRLRLEVTSGSFPMYDVNPQSGVAPATAGPRDYLPATHAVFHTAAMPSRLIITVANASPAEARA